jgi:hypothetical protein
VLCLDQRRYRPMREKPKDLSTAQVPIALAGLTHELASPAAAALVFRSLWIRCCDNYFTENSLSQLFDDTMEKIRGMRRFKTISEVNNRLRKWLVHNQVVAFL